MALDEAMRLRINGKLEELLGHDEAAALMNELRDDDRIDSRFDRIDDRFDRIDERFERLESRLADRFDRIDERFAMFELRMTDKVELAVAQARAETAREGRFALLTSFGLVTAVATAVLSAIGFFS